MSRYIQSPEGRGLEWITKTDGHRGVQYLNLTEAAKHPELQTEHALVQELIRPHLIDGWPSWLGGNND